jgi:hypothetical protein
MTSWAWRTLRRPGSFIAVRQGDDSDAFISAHVEEMRIGRSELKVPSSCRLSGDAVGQTHGSTLAVILPSTEQASLQCDRDLDRRRSGEVKLGQVEDGILWICPHETHEMIEDFGYSECSERDFFGVYKSLDLGGGGFILQESENGIGVENDHLRRSRATSSTVD